MFQVGDLVRAAAHYRRFTSGSWRDLSPNSLLSADVGRVIGTKPEKGLVLVRWSESPGVTRYPSRWTHEREFVSVSL